MSELNRRQFVAASVACAGLCLLGEDASAQAKSAQVDIGFPTDFPAGETSTKFLKPNGFLVVHNEGRIYALNARCPHRGTTVAIKDGVIRCPSHGSSFSQDGTPTAGPAKAALFRFGIAADDKGRLIVDKSRQFGEKQWDEQGSFYKVG